MADPNQEQLAALDAQIQASPSYQAFKNKPNKSAMDAPKLAAALAQEGLVLPHDYALDFGPQGLAVVKKGFTDRNGWAIPALIIGGTLTGGAALGAMGGATAATGAAATGGGAVAGGGTATGALAGGLTPSFAVPGALAGVEGGAAATGGWGAMLGAASKYAKPVAGALNTMSQSMANNRGEKLAANQLADQVATNRQAENRNERSDTWHKLQAADYLQRGDRSGGFGAHGSTFNPPPLSAPMQQGAEGLEREALLRLVNGPQIKPLTDVEEGSKQGGWEKFAGLAGMGLSIFGR